MKICINCEFESDGKHCPECGQKLEVPRITLKGTVLEFFARWIGFDNQFGRTVKHMFIKPGVVVKTYLKGNRVKYLGPLGYLVVMTALLLLSFDIFGISVEDYMASQSSTISNSFIGEGQAITKKQIEAQEAIMSIIAKNFRLVTVSIIPFLALVFGWFYSKEKLNFMERFMMFSFISGNALWLNIIGVVIFALTGKGVEFLLSFISMLYVIFAVSNSFSKKPLLLGIGRALLMLVSGYVIWFLVQLIILSPIVYSIIKEIPEG